MVTLKMPRRISPGQHPKPAHKKETNLSQNTSSSPVVQQMKVQIKSGLLPRLRTVHAIASEDEQARMIGVDRTTLRRVEAGAQPSGFFMASLSDAFGLGLGEAFDVVAGEPLGTVA